MKSKFTAAGTLVHAEFWNVRSDQGASNKRPIIPLRVTECYPIITLLLFLNRFTWIFAGSLFADCVNQNRQCRVHLHRHDGQDSISRISLSDMKRHVLELRVGIWTELVKKAETTTRRSRRLDIVEVLFLRVFIDRANMYPAILTEQSWSVKNYFMALRLLFYCGIHQLILAVQDSSNSLTGVARHSAKFGLSSALTKLADHVMIAITDCE